MATSRLRASHAFQYCRNRPRSTMTIARTATSPVHLTLGSRETGRIAKVASHQRAWRASTTAAGNVAAGSTFPAMTGMEPTYAYGMASAVRRDGAGQRAADWGPAATEPVGPMAHPVPTCRRRDSRIAAIWMRGYYAPATSRPRPGCCSTLDPAFPASLRQGVREFRARRGYRGKAVQLNDMPTPEDFRRYREVVDAVEQAWSGEGSVEARARLVQELDARGIPLPPGPLLGHRSDRIAGGHGPARPSSRIFHRVSPDG